MLEAERRSAAKPEKTEERRAVEHARRSWHRNIESIWFHAHLMDTAELEWFSAIVAASEAKGTRKVRTWSRGTIGVPRVTTSDDAIRIEALRAELWERDRKRDAEQDRKDRLTVIAALNALGRPVPAWLAEVYG